MSKRNSGSSGGGGGGGGGGGVGLATVFLIVFVTLKLLEVEPVASWSWVWVLSPFWIPLFLFGGLLLIGYTVSSISDAIASRRAMRRLLEQGEDPPPSMKT